mmetsp:Transcript_29915/g.54785  ORF Transcript_29915/g.54785 Transcript_29915/m.54785 type:complete len:160 (-) Transcript_29915:304-783(-)
MPKLLGLLELRDQVGELSTGSLQRTLGPLPRNACSSPRAPCPYLRGELLRTSMLSRMPTRSRALGSEAVARLGLNDWRSRSIGEPCRRAAEFNAESYDRLNARIAPSPAMLSIPAPGECSDGGRCPEAGDADDARALLCLVGEALLGTSPENENGEPKL